MTLDALGALFSLTGVARLVREVGLGLRFRSPEVSEAQFLVFEGRKDQELPLES